MRKVVVSVFLVLMFSLFSTTGLFAATAPVPPKKPLPKIDIKKVTLEAEAKGVVPSGLPLMALVEVSASEDIAGPFAVNLELRKGQVKQAFKEGIEKLNKGLNSYKWDLTGKPEDGSYAVSVEIIGQDPKLKDKYTKIFRVGEKTKVEKKEALEKEVAEKEPVVSTEVKAKPVKEKPVKPQTTHTTKATKTTTATTTTTTKTTKAEPAKPQATQSKTTKSSGTKSTGEIKEITFAGVMLTGSFIQQSSGVYIGQGEVKPNWDFDIRLNATGDLTIDTNQKKITGQLNIHVPVLGDIGKVTDLSISPSGISFNGEAVEAFKIGPLTLQLAKATALFELSSTIIKATAEAGLGITVTGIPGISEISIDIESVDAGFETPVEHPALKVSGSGTVEIPPTPVTPPIKVDLSGNLGLAANGVSGDGKVKVFDIEVGNGDFNINTKGIISININAGIFEEGVVECGLAKTTMTIDMPKGLLTAGISQEVKLFDEVTIPGSVKADLEINARTKKMKISGKAGIPLTGSVMGPEVLSLGIRGFVFEMNPYNSTNPKIKLAGDAYVSLWTMASFTGDIDNAILIGTGKLNLPSGLDKLLDMKSIDLPVRVDLRSGQTIAQLGGEIKDLTIKHFPLVGPEILVKNDGIHLKGQIGIANVITVPLGDLVFKQDTSYTTIDGNIGIGPFTMAKGKITLPAKAGDGIGFSGEMGIPGLLNQSISGSVYKEGDRARADLSGMNSIGFITVDALTKFEVSKTKLHADTAKFSVGISKAAKCSLAFTSLDITKSLIEGRATAAFTGILGIGGSLRGDFWFDGETVRLTYPDAISLCGISVTKAVLRMNTGGVTGSGTISAAGQSTDITITIENDVVKLRGLAGKLIAEGMRIVDKLYDTTAEIASEEKDSITEHGGDTLDNLSRMTDPWVKDVVAAARAAKSVYNAIEKIVLDEVTKQVKAALDDLKKIVDTAVLFAKSAIAAAVDAVCNGIIAMVDGVKAIFAQIESIVPAKLIDEYTIVKAKVIEKANAVKARIVTFRDETKASLYDLTGTITKIYQGAIDQVTGEANKIAAAVKKEMEPAIKEIDVLLTEIGQEIDAATNAVGDEATRHYNIAKQKAEILKTKANGLTSKYKDKVGDLIAPYTKPIIEKISAEKAKVTKVRDDAIAEAIKGLTAAKDALYEPVIKPFEDVVKKLRDFAFGIGGEIYDKFLDGIGAAGNAMNTALGAAGKGLVKATDIVGDAAVAVSGAAADVSEAAYEAAAATINFVQDTGSQAVSLAVDTAQAGYQTATQAASQAAAAAEQAASQAYQTATQVAAAAQKQVTSTVTTVINNLAAIPSSSFATGMPLSFSDIQSGAAAISAKVSDILNALDGYATAAYGTVSGAASSVGSAISSGATAVANGIEARWKSATRSISSYFGSSNPAPAPTVDYTAPAILNVAATSTMTSITVTWNTSFNSRTIMFYGKTPNLSFSGQDANTTVVSIHDGASYPETTSHTLTVSGLSSGTAYYYIVYAVSAMAGGNSTDAGKNGPYLIVTQPSTAIIGGLVKDTAANALLGAKIYLGSATTSVAATDATGRYTLEVNPGAQTVTAKKDNYLSSSTTTASLTAGQILPLDFTLNDGRIQISGTVKDAGTSAGLASATVTLTGLPTVITLPTAADGTFTTVLGTTGGPLTFTMSASKTDYTTYTSSQITLAPGAKMQNVEIKLPHTAPAVNAEGVSVGGITAAQATIFFITNANCSAFVQLGLQSVANYTYQTPVKTNRNSFYFDLVGLVPSTAYKYKVVLQDGFGNTVVAKESTFTTASSVSTNTDIAISATVTNIIGSSAKLNITSAFNTLKYQLVLRDTTTNTQVPSQDLGLLVSPVSVNLRNLTDGHSYSADLTGSLLANVTTGSSIKTATKSVTFQVPALKSVVIKDLKVDPDMVKRGTATTANVSATVRINHAVTAAVLKVFADTTELYSQSMGNLSPGEAKITVPLAVTSIPGTGPVDIKLKVSAAGNIQESSTCTIEVVAAGSQTGGSQPKTQNKTGKPVAV